MTWARTIRRGGASLVLWLGLAGQAFSASVSSDVAAVTNATAATAAPAPALTLTNDLITLEEVTARLTALSNRTDLAAASRTNALGLYLEAQQRLLEAARHGEETLRLRRDTTNAPAMAAELQAQLAAPLPTPTLTMASNAPLAELEQLLAQKEAELAQATKDRDALAQEPQRRAARTTELAVLLTAARAARDRVQQELGTPPPPELDPELREATHDLQQARLQFRDAELTRYTEESASLNAVAELMRLRLDTARRRLTILTQERDLVVSTLNRRRGQETLQAAARAEQAQRRADLLREPVLSRLASTNAALARERAELAERLRVTTARLDDVNTNLATQRSAFQGIKARVEAAAKAGLRRNFSVGILLRRQQAYLKSLGDYRREARREQAAISTVQIAQFAASDARRGLEPLEATTDALLAALPADTDPDRLRLVREEAAVLLAEQRDLLTALARDHDTQISLLLRLNAALGDSATLIDEFTAYLDQRVLWIRSLGFLDGAALRNEAQAMWGVLTSPGWPPAFAALADELRTTLPSTLPVLLGALLLLVLQPRLRRRLSEESATARQGRNTLIQPTFSALWCSLVLALPLPLIFALVGWRSLGSAAGNSVPLMDHLGWALLMAAVVLFVWGVLWQFVGPDGLAVAHFRLAEEDAALLRRSLSRYLIWIVPFAVANALFEGEPAEGVSNRLTFIVTSLLFALFAHVVLRPGGGLSLGSAADAAGGSRVRLGRRLLHAVTVLVPLLLAAASVIGYNYSARQLWLRFLTSLLLLLAVQLLSALLLRWVYLVRRRLAMAHAEKQRSEEDAAAPTPTEVLPVVEDQTQSELLTWLEQAQRLVRWTAALAVIGCLLAVWSGVLPALQALDDVPLWHLEPTPGSSPSASGSSSPASAISNLATGSAAATSAASGGDEAPTGARFVSVWNLLVVLLILAVTVAASQNLAGFLEMAVFSHVRLDRGTGYAITTTARYAIILIGVILAARGLGLSWSKVQWLAAAVTVGIGFGLQEIFANFVSGLILLFERPLRVGDIVTVGDTSGVVVQIHIRATTIRDWDNRELILPNKALITGGFLNWTLSDSITRIVVNVGISYDANPRQARDRLLALARANPNILTDPGPVVTFEGFGESTLNLALRAHVNRPDQRASTTFDLHAAILEDFRRAGIEIAFPQRDLHLRSVPPGWSLTSPAPAAEARNAAS